MKKGAEKPARAARPSSAKQTEAEKKPTKRKPPTNGHLFQPGQSGNPKGRPPVGKSLAEIVRRIGEEPHETDRNKTRLEVIIRKLYKDAAHGKYGAAMLILDRGWGKAPQPIHGAEDHEPVIIRIVQG